VTIALTRLERANFSTVKGRWFGRLQDKIDFGPGYRIYSAKVGDQIVILLGGGTKRRQRQDIATAKECWAAYKRRKKQES
jgi:putative addiction module killer protein